MNNKLNCISCNKEIKRLDKEDDSPDSSAMWNGGVVGTIAAGYGSRHDTDMFTIAVCDDCLDSVSVVGNYMDDEYQVEREVEVKVGSKYYT